jgi:multidrug efflux pump subunit AcrA (membrane-fusion protein)
LEEVTITPKVTGRVVKIYYDVQDAVPPGKVLLEIDPTDYQLAVEEARRGLASELAKLGLTEVPKEGADLAGLLSGLPSVDRTRNQEKNALGKLRRAQPLQQSRTLTQEDYEQIETDYRVARAARQQAEMDALATLATARLKQAVLATATQRLADTRVAAPPPKEKTVAENRAEMPDVRYAAANRPHPNPLPEGEGTSQTPQFVVAKRMAEVGEMVAVNASPVYRLVRDDILKLYATVPERYISQVQKGQQIEVSTEAYPGKVFPGELKRISPTVDPASRTFQIEVWVVNPPRPDVSGRSERMLKAGGFAKLAIVTETAGQALTVPAESIVNYAGVNKVFTIRDSKAHVVAVKLGSEGTTPQGRWIEVTPEKPQELTPGMKVITRGHLQLAEGSEVQIQQAERKD